MNDVETKLLFEGKNIRAECMNDGKPLARPIYIKIGMHGWYFSCENAEALAAELLCAVAAARASAETRMTGSGGGGWP